MKSTRRTLFKILSGLFAAVSTGYTFVKEHTPWRSNNAWVMRGKFDKSILGQISYIHPSNITPREFVKYDNQRKYEDGRMDHVFKAAKEFVKRNGHSM